MAKGRTTRNDSYHKGRGGRVSGGGGVGRGSRVAGRGRYDYNDHDYHDDDFRRSLNRLREANGRLDRCGERSSVGGRGGGGVAGAVPDDDEREREIVPLLAARAYHLPGNSWCQDWLQYMGNNHPVFGIFCHHRLHPVAMWMRVVHLLGSFVFGLAVTNVIWLWFTASEDRDPDEVVFSVTVTGTLYNTTYEVLGRRGNATSPVETEQTVDFTRGMVVLWTVGGGLHALFDNTVWFLSACYCCLPGQALERLERYRWCGTYFIVVAVVACAAVATLVIVLRATFEAYYDDDDDGGYDPAGADNGNSTNSSSTTSFGDTLRHIELHQITDDTEYTFVISYMGELFLALMLYYPVVGTLLFCGILGCGNVPVLGGRPYEVKLERERLEKRERRRRGGIYESDGKFAFL